jgi:hypothetical protein
MTSSSPIPTTSTAAFSLQAAVSFGVAVVAVGTGIAYLPVDAWVRAFLAIGTLFLISSCFTLAKCVRDQQEASTVRVRLDEARLEKLVAGHDPFGTSFAA